MNLMFWKKKTGAGAEAENTRENPAANPKPRESLDFVAAEQDVAERDPDSPDPEATSQAKPGLVARLKLRLTALTGHFRKAPAFRADEEHVPDTLGGSGKPGDAAAMEPDMESPDMEAPAKPGLAVRMKLRLITLTRRFRKTPAPDAEEDEDRADRDEESPAPETPAKPGLLVRIKAGFAAFTREFKASAAPAASEDQDADSHDRSGAAPEGEPPEDFPGTEPARSRRGLVIGGAVGLLVLLLVGIGIAIWPIFTPSQQRWGTKHDMTTITSRAIRPESAPEKPQTTAPEAPQTETEALRKENAELQARIEALKKEPPQQRPYVPPARQTGGSTPSSSVSGEMMVGNKDPKAAAMSLKEAIEAMNADSGEDDKKPAK